MGLRCHPCWPALCSLIASAFDHREHLCLSEQPPAGAPAFALAVSARFQRLCAHPTTRPLPLPPPTATSRRLNKCGVQTPTQNPPVVYAPRNPNVLAIMQQAALKAHQQFKQPPRLLLVVLPDTGG